MIIFIFFAIKPTVETILVLQKKLENSNQVLEKLKAKTETLNQGKQNYENLDQSTKTRIHNAIPDTIDLKSLILTLEDSAKRHEASISALQIQPQLLEIKQENQVGTLSEIGFTFNVEGTYPNINSILQDLKTSSRLISIDNLTLNKISEGSGIIMSITGKALHIK